MCKQWDVDKLEQEIPVCVINEWNEFLNYEIEEIASAIMQVLPAAGGFLGVKSNNTGNTIHIKTHEEKMAMFDTLGKMSNGK